ncbi:YkvA family protein [Gorillibacterium sp. CAU 1737]|uniref:YkvA family protein n=1 Tax=Gorillibacterium sp. CAU 1737 TaxID=3140362 RepID=UPI0032603523
MANRLRFPWKKEQPSSNPPASSQEEKALVRHEGESDEEYVRHHFWSKLKAHAEQVPFLQDVIALFYCAMDPKTPKWAKAIAFSGLAYFILPIDAIPDVFLLAGWTDDAAILAGALKTLSSKVTNDHRDKAKAWISGRKLVQHGPAPESKA